MVASMPIEERRGHEILMSAVNLLPKYLIFMTFFPSVPTRARARPSHRG